MSANPTRFDCNASMAADAATPLQEGNRVLESIARQEALHALLAFSGLHEQIRNRRMATGRTSDQDLFETERFILDEVLQLICNRAQTLSGADGVVIALVTGAEVICRASAGPLSVERGVRLIGDSEILQDCLDSGRILRSDDCDIDARVELDLARQIGARSTVLIPLRGRHEQVGVLQAMSSTPWAFTDHDIRCFDLFAELVLSALKPEDQDRRIHWLSDVAGEVLKMRSADSEPASHNNAASEITEATALGLAVDTVLATPSVVPPPQNLPEAIPAAASASKEIVTLSPAVGSAGPAKESVAPAPEVAKPAIAEEPPETFFHSTFAIGNSEFHEPEIGESGALESPIEDLASRDFGILENDPAPSQKPFRLLSFPRRAAASGGSRPGVSVVLGLVAVAALFSLGVWWGTQTHGKPGTAREIAASTVLSQGDAKLSPQSITTPAVPAAGVLAPAVSDNLMVPARAGSENAPLVAVSADRLAALPKVTGVRHWSSSVGSTVVIDMEDQVPYEVHRLMSPERIYFDLHDTVLLHHLDGTTMDVGDASLARVRIAQPVAGVTRIVLDTKDGSNFSVSMESNPYRLVVELRSTEKGSSSHMASARALAPAAALPARSPAPLKTIPEVALAVKPSDQPIPAKTGKFRIVLDAGHGGWDLGTVGRQGLLEKDLVLDVTQRLGKLLQMRLGSEVMFTRTGDSYLPLDLRADVANRAQADLFVSVHANYSSSATARGVETYYTNLFSPPGSRELEKHEDGTSPKLTPVSLSSGALHEKIEESRRLALSVQHSLYATLAGSSPDIRNRGIKDASFAVLTGTTMPAILTEISFVSSPADERNLQSATYRQQIAEALYQGIARYQQSSPHAKIAQLQTAAARR
jgi:N-acetylmuramoyl-L-alanine amidase